jgi:hypothetical protein
MSLRLAFEPFSSEWQGSNAIAALAVILQTAGRFPENILLPSYPVLAQVVPPYSDTSARGTAPGMKNDGPDLVEPLV